MSVIRVSTLLEVDQVVCLVFGTPEAYFVSFNFLVKALWAPTLRGVSAK